MEEDKGLQRDGDQTSRAARIDAVHGMLEHISELESGIRRLQAEQVKAVAKFIDERQRLDEELGCPHPAQYRSMIAEVAIAMRVSVGTAQGLMSDAYQLVTNNPRTLEALASGKLGLSPARAVAVETAVIEDEALRRLADEVIAEEAVDLLPGKVRQLAERRVIEIDPDAAARRSTRARADRHVRLVAAGADTAYLDAYLPVEQATSCWQSLHEHAVARKAAGDERSMSHLMCDTLVERITGAAKAGETTTNICLVMSDKTFLGLDDAPAHLIGGGPITGQLARRIAGSGHAWVRRFFTDPVDGSATQMDSRKRLVDGNLRSLVMLADQYCRGIRCASPIRDVDHVIEYSSGGHTTFRNAQGLSKGCHVSRDHPHMTVEGRPESRITTWTTPSGLTHTSLPPPMLGPGSLSRQQLRLRHWLAHPPTSAMERYMVQLIVEHTRTPHAAPDRPDPPPSTPGAT